MRKIRPYTTKNISITEANSFIETNHRQGTINTLSQSIGLFSKEDELIGVLQCGPSRTSAMIKKYSNEIYRLCFKKDVRVPGGASKLIKNYIDMFNPTDFFTYQDTTGENTKIYEHSHMTLVKDGLLSQKEYLVAPGKTLTTGNRKEVLGMAYAVRYGPDRILGTKIGEIFNESNIRKSNKEIFIEELGWHIETTTADSIWEWFNPHYTFYTYKITATDSDKYYYGLSHLKKANASITDCLNDPYFGSGGINSKFQKWKKKHSTTLKKEIITTHRSKAEAYNKEKELIGDLHISDTLCLNSMQGGLMQFPTVKKSRKNYCEIHGETKFNGNTCYKCASKKNYSYHMCEIHGETIFNGDTCCKCISKKNIVIKECPVHGKTSFAGNRCYKCSNKSNIQKCSIHGKVNFVGDHCMMCKNQQSIDVKQCPVHGESKFIGDKCYKCNTQQSITIKNCPVHGETKHRKDSCFKCRTNNTKFTLKECVTHGETKFIGDKCVKCTRGAIEIKRCPVHGETKHRANSCFKCSAAKRKSRS